VSRLMHCIKCSNRIAVDAHQQRKRAVEPRGSDNRPRFGSCIRIQPLSRTCTGSTRGWQRRLKAVKYHATRSRRREENPMLYACYKRIPSRGVKRINVRTSPRSRWSDQPPSIWGAFKAIIVLSSLFANILVVL